MVLQSVVALIRVRSAEQRSESGVSVIRIGNVVVVVVAGRERR